MRGGLFSIGGGLFLVGGGLFPSPTVAEKSPTPARKSPTPAEKSPTAIPKRCWTLEYSGELEFSSPVLEQWTLDARGVLIIETPACPAGFFPITPTAVTNINPCYLQKFGIIHSLSVICNKTKHKRMNIYLR